MEDNASAPPPTSIESKVLAVLTRARKDLWNARVTGITACILDPVRDFILDPLFAICSVLLPPLTSLIPGSDYILASILSFGIRYGLHVIYRPVPQDEIDMRRRASEDILISNKAGIKLPTFKPPSDLASAFRGSIAFIESAIADVIKVCMDRKKMHKWFQTGTEFKAYMDVSGVGDELEEAIYKPLVRGRLLDNVKILNDIQEEMYAGRCQKISTYSAEEIQAPIQEGKRMMRFATAAYGTEMIRSALDREAHPHELENQMKAIAFHCNVVPQDIRVLEVNDGGDTHVLRHFVAIDREISSVVLAIRGTLSVSGALVDMQGMDCDFCGCKAHQGMAQMADSIWSHSGDKIMKLFDEEDELKDFSFTIVGHSLGAGAACLLNIKCYKENLLGDRIVKCYGFAPPPTLCTDELKDGAEDAASIQRAIDNTLCYIHDNDCVPFLSVMCIRRLATLMDTVDNRTEHMWAFRRFKIFWEWEKIPQELIDDVKLAEANKEGVQRCEGASRLIIPAKMVVWMKKNFAGGSYEGFGCDPSAVADLNIFCCQDMITDHLVEPYEDALDELAGVELVASHDKVPSS